MEGYFLLLGLFLALAFATFYFGIREWLTPEDNTPLPVDVEYIRMENYFGVSFRSKMQEWLKAAQPVEEPQPEGSLVRQVLKKPNGERILVLSEGQFGSPDGTDDLIFCEGDLQLPDRSVFSREIYCRGNLRSSEDVQLQAVAADGDIILGANNEVSRWLDGRRKVVIRPGTVIHSRVSSEESIELGDDVSVQSLYAPIIFTTGYIPGSILAITTQLTAPIRKAEELPKEQEVPPYLDEATASLLAADTWLVRDDLELKDGERVEGDLIVHGRLHTGSHCHFMGNVKAGEIEIGPQNRVYGNLVSGAGIEVGPDTMIAKSIAAETDILLRSGVRVGRPGAPVALSAGQEVTLERDVAVCGKVAAGRAVLAVG